MNYLEKLLLFMIILLIRNKLIAMCNTYSPCPNIFLYKFQKNIWYGELKIQVPDRNEKNVKLEVAYYTRIRLDRNSIENTLYTINTDEEFVSNIANGRPITYILSIPNQLRNDLPRIANITLNGNIICNDNVNEANEAVGAVSVKRNIVVQERIESTQVRKPVTNGASVSPQQLQQQLQELKKQQQLLLQQQQLLVQQKQQEQQRQQLLQQQLQEQQQQREQLLQQQQREQLLQQQQREQLLQQQQREQLLQQQQKKQQQQQNQISSNRIFIVTEPNDKCGIIPENPVPISLVANGEVADKQPWLVALFDNDQQQPKFFCAATLISTQFVVTAAHCTIARSFVFIKLGVKDVSSINGPEGIFRISEKVKNHPEYRSQSSHADIAVVKMADPVSFDNTIQPVCLWPNMYLDEKTITGKEARIFGWGNDEFGHLTLSAPKKADLIIKSYAECKQMDLLNNIISDKTICATSVNRISGPCLGDSGGGLYVYVNDKWTIRGVISAAIGKQTSGICDVQNYFSVYTDTGKYFDWIVNTVNTI